MQAFGKGAGVPTMETLSQFAKAEGEMNSPRKPQRVGNPKVSGKALAVALMKNAHKQ